MAAVVFTVDAETPRHARSNEEVAEGARRNADVLIPFACIDPAGRAGVKQARRLVGTTGCAASSSTPACRASSPTTLAYPLYEISRSSACRPVPHRADRHRRREPGGGGSG